MKTSLLIAAAIVALAAGSYTAEAGCVHRTQEAAAKSVKLPKFPQRPGQPQANKGASLIVGLWHVEHRLPDGSLYFESLEHYHADGTEFEFANQNPAIGDVCMGVYSQTDRHSVSLYHIGWNFDGAGTPIGIFTLEGPRKVTNHGSRLEGTFDAKIYDVDGNLVEEDTGTTTGERISAP
jgi:hypothetical protein